jgi:Mg-chelatase subunit ChlI
VEKKQRVVKTKESKNNEGEKKFEKEEKEIEKDVIEEEKEKEKEEEKEKEKEEGEKEKEKAAKENVGKKKKGKKIENEVTKKRKTRGQTKMRVRVQQNSALKMMTVMVDGNLNPDTFVTVVTDDACFGGRSIAFVMPEDFEALFAVGEMTGSIITSYMM